MKFKQIFENISKGKFPGNKWNFNEMNENELWEYPQDNDVTDVGQISKKQKQWLSKWLRKGLLFRYRDKALPRFNTLYSIHEFGNYLPWK